MVGRSPDVDAGYAVGIRQAVDLLAAMLTRGEEFGFPLRQGQAVYPPVALRELLGNALFHQDLTADGAGPAVDVFLDRVEFSSPGAPLVEVTRFLDSARSRNVTLVKLARSMHLCEKSGSGIDRAVEAIERAHLPPPVFSVPNEQTRAALLAPKPFAAWTREERALACYQHACLRHERGQDMTNTTLRERFGLGEGEYKPATKVIQDAIAEGLIVEKPQISRSTRDRRYKPFWS